MNVNFPRKGFIVIAFALLLVSASVPFAHAARQGGGGGATQTTYSGRAIAIRVDTSLLDINFADTGELPPQGGESDATVLTVQHALVQAEVLLSVTMGFDNKAQSTAAVASIVLLPGSAYQITADFVRSDTKVTCDSAFASSEIVNLKLLGSTIVVTGEAGQKITVPGVLTLTINEVNTSRGSTNIATAIALHLVLSTGDEVAVSFAKSDITCGGGKPPRIKKDFVTGGGFINKDGSKANFGFVAGFKPGKTTVSGQLNYIDHSSGLHVKSASVASYGGTGVCRSFAGTTTTGLGYTVNVCDNGEPGRADTFSISLSDGYSASGVLAGGNVQLHT